MDKPAMNMADKGKVEVVHAFAVPRGMVLVFSDPGATSFSDELLRAFRGKDVLVTKQDGTQVSCPVADVSISRSLVGQRNIMFGCPSLPGEASEYVGAWISLRD